MNLLLETADELRLPSDPEFRSALVAYLECGSCLAVINSALPAETPVIDSPVPASFMRAPLERKTFKASRVPSWPVTGLPPAIGPRRVRRGRVSLRHPEY
jgi:hypothetical protein